MQQRMITGAHVDRRLGSVKKWFVAMLLYVGAIAGFLQVPSRAEQPSCGSGITDCHIKARRLLRPWCIQGKVISTNKAAQASPPRADWRLLLLGVDRRIVKLKVVMFQIVNKEDAVSLFLPPERKQPCEFETRDPAILHMASTFLGWSSRSAIADVVPESPYIGVTSRTLGYVEVTTTRDTFRVGVCRAGFLLSSTRPSVRNYFKSWGFAKILDDLLDKHGQPRLDPETFAQLSGEAEISCDKRTMGSIREIYEGNANGPAQGEH